MDILVDIIYVLASDNLDLSNNSVIECVETNVKNKLGKDNFSSEDNVIRCQRYDYEESVVEKTTFS